MPYIEKRAQELGFQLNGEARLRFAEVAIRQGNSNVRYLAWTICPCAHKLACPVAQAVEQLLESADSVDALVKLSVSAANSGQAERKTKPIPHACAVLTAALVAFSLAKAARAKKGEVSPEAVKELTSRYNMDDGVDVLSDRVGLPSPACLYSDP